MVQKAFQSKAFLRLWLTAADALCDSCQRFPASTVWEQISTGRMLLSHCTDWSWLPEPVCHQTTGLTEHVQKNPGELHWIQHDYMKTPVHPGCFQSRKRFLKSSSFFTWRHFTEVKKKMKFWNSLLQQQSICKSLHAVQWRGFVPRRAWTSLLIFSASTVNFMTPAAVLSDSPVHPWRILVCLFRLWMLQISSVQIMRREACTTDGWSCLFGVFAFLDVWTCDVTHQ